jgi:outer membrane protein TolC
MKQIFRPTQWRLCITAGLLLIGQPLMLNAADGSHLLNKQTEALSLKQAIQLAHKNDPWLRANRYLQDSMESLSIASGTLPDPKISLGIANIGSDSFDFNQEAMTQFKVGVSQVLPRGDSLKIKQQQLSHLAKQYPFMRDDRRAKVTVDVAKLWLDAFKAQQSVELIEKDRALFEQLADVAEAGYSSAVGKTRQQDIVRAQLELTRLDDRLTMLKQQFAMSKGKLSEYLMMSDDRYESDTNQNSSHAFTLYPYVFSKSISDNKLIQNNLVLAEESISSQTLFEYFSLHPMIKALEQKIKASEIAIQLTKQQYKPQWGLNASYGYRDSTPIGLDRSDLFSIGVTFDMPLFTTHKQDKNVQSAISKSSVSKTKKWLLLRKMMASFESNRVMLKSLIKRKKLYKVRLLPQIHDQAEASLTAYTNDNGDFSEVVRSRIAELNASIDYLNIDVEIQKSIFQSNYFFTQYLSEGEIQ